MATKWVNVRKIEGGEIGIIVEKWYDGAGHILLFVCLVNEVGISHEDNNYWGLQNEPKTLMIGWQLAYMSLGVTCSGTATKGVNAKEGGEVLVFSERLLQQVKM